MKIAFCGASGTGKTTLATWLAQELDLPFNPVGSRSVAASMGFDNPYDVDRADLSWYEHLLKEGKSVQEAAEKAVSVPRVGETCRGLFQQKLLEAKIAWEEDHPEGFVTDRTTVDNLVYAALHNIHGVDEDYYHTAISHLLNTYDLVFFTPLASFHDHAGDPHRMSYTTYHTLYEHFCDGVLISKLADDWNEVVWFVGNTELEERKQEVFKRVRQRRGFRDRERYRILQDLLRLADKDVPRSRLVELTDKEFEEAELWAACVHLRASDNQAPYRPMPEWLTDHPSVESFET